MSLKKPHQPYSVYHYKVPTPLLPFNNLSMQPTTFICNVRFAFRLCSHGEPYSTVFNTSSFLDPNWQNKMNLSRSSKVIVQEISNIQAKQMHYPIFVFTIQRGPTAKLFRSFILKKTLKMNILKQSFYVLRLKVGNSF